MTNQTQPTQDNKIWIGGFFEKTMKNGQTYWTCSAGPQTYILYQNTKQGENAPTFRLCVTASPQPRTTAAKGSWNKQQTWQSKTGKQTQASSEGHQEFAPVSNGSYQLSDETPF